MDMQISLGTKYQLKLTTLIFWTKFNKKRFFRPKTEGVNTTIEFCIVELVSVPNFSLNWQFCFFGPNFPKKVLSVENRKSQLYHWIVDIRISLGTKIQLKQTILIFWTKFTQKRVSLVENRKNEHHHWVLHIRISLGIKFQCKLTILIF